jgi:mRNA interferase MazF
MTPFEQGAVVLVYFPFTNLRASKRRPAVVISANWLNQSRQDCILLAITSQVPTQLDRDEITLSTNDLLAAGLPKSSIVKLGKIITLEQNLIVKQLGQLPEATIQQLVRAIRKVF